METMGRFAGHGGLVLTGMKASAHLRVLRYQLPGATLLHDREGYREQTATADDPFILPKAGLFGAVPLEQVLDEQLAMGTSVALTPTAHVQSGDTASLAAIVSAVAKLHRDDLLVHFPLDAEWLSDELVDGLLAAIERCNHPVAISLAHQRDPLDVRGVAENLHRVAEHEVPIVLLRTDLAGLDFVARGGMAAAIGATSTLRHGLSPSRRGFKTNVTDTRTNVLLTEMLRFVTPATMERVFPVAPTCSCRICAGRRLDRFTPVSRSQQEARTHNLAMIEALVDQLDASGVGNRIKEWRRLVRDSIAAHELHANENQVGDWRIPHTHEIWAC